MKIIIFIADIYGVVLIQLKYMYNVNAYTGDIVDDVVARHAGCGLVSRFKKLNLGRRFESQIWIPSL